MTKGEKLDVVEIIRITQRNLSQDMAEDELIEGLVETIPHINAVQVITEQEIDIKIGTVAYVVSFSDDVHG